MFDDLLQFWLLAIDLNFLWIYNTYLSELLVRADIRGDGLSRNLCIDEERLQIKI